MMAGAVYILCAVLSLACALLLARAYRRSRNRLLLWSALCFFGLMIENLLDKVVRCRQCKTTFRPASPTSPASAPVVPLAEEDVPTVALADEPDESAALCTERSERRRDAGSLGECPLPELFNAVRVRFPDLTLPTFQDGLKRLHDVRAVRLAPAAEVAEPEYAVVVDGKLMYAAGR